MVWGAVVVVAAWLGAARTATAEQPQREFPEVVVTATRTQTRVDDATSSISVINSDDIEKRDASSLADALRGTPGLNVTEFGSAGQSAFVSVRGAAPDQVLVLLDGVEVNSTTTGQFDFANLTTESIERIEVLRGGGGTLYGADAIGGVVNVISRRGDGPLRLSASGEAGSAATHHEVLRLDGSRGALALDGAVALLASEGFRSINDDYRNLSTVWRADADILPRATLRGFLRYSSSRAGLANFNVADGVLDSDAHSRSDFLLAKGEWEHAPTDHLNYRTSISFVRDNQRFRDDQPNPDQPGASQPVVIAHFPSELITAEAQLDYSWRDIALTTVGLEVKERSAQVFKFQRRVEEEDESESAATRFNANRSNVALYGQQQLHTRDNTLQAVGGLRYDHSDRFGDEVTWSGSGSYLLRPTRTRFRLGYAEGFRVPTFNELFEPSLGNPTLQPEHSWEIDAGLTQEFFDGRLRIEPTYFYRQVTNLIEEVVDQLPGPIAVPEEEEGALPLTRNLNARFQGVEITVRGQPIRGITIGSTYTYLNFVTPTSVLVNRPRHRGSFFATAEHSGLLLADDGVTLTVLVHAVGRRDSADPRNDFEPAQIGGYARTDLAAAYRFGGRFASLAATATVRNLFNRDYSESIGFPAPPARFLMGLRYEL